nr:unnamed protein product [Callosobruchus analis]
MWMYTIAKVICVANTAVQTLLKTTVTDLSESDEESSKVFNKLGAISALSFLFGILLGSQIADYARGIDYIHLLVISNIVVCIGKCISVCLIKTLPRVASKGNKSAEKDDSLPQGPLQQITSVYENLKKLVTSPRFWDIFTMKLLMEYGFFMYYNSSALTLRTDYSVSDKYIGFIITGIMVFSVGSNLIISKVKAKFYPTDPGYLKIWHFTLVQALAYLTLTLASSLPLFIMAMVANSCAKTFIDSSLNDLLLAKTESAEKGIVMSSYDNVFSIGQVLGPVTAGTASEIFGIRSSFMLSGVS